MISREELNSAAILDLVSDAEAAEAQAISGPFCPERGITAEKLRAYAAKCRLDIDRLRDSSAHASSLLRSTTT